MVFCPCWVTSQTGPTFSVISMRPSGRKARRQGRLNVVTVVMVKGRLVSDFCSPALIWAHAAVDARVSSNAAFANFIVISPCFLSAQLTRSGALLAIVYFITKIRKEPLMKSSALRTGIRLLSSCTLCSLILMDSFSQFRPADSLRPLLWQDGMKRSEVGEINVFRRFPAERRAQMADFFAGVLGLTALSAAAL